MICTFFHILIINLIFLV